MGDRSAGPGRHPLYIKRLPRMVFVLVALLHSPGYNSPAQVAVTHAQMRELFGRAGGRLEAYGDSGASVVNIGRTGGPNVYDFTGLRYSSPDLLTTYKVADVPILRGHFPDSAVTFGESPQSIRNNPIFLFVPDTMLEIGNVWIHPPFDTMRSQHYAPGIPQFGRFPVLYGSSSSYTTVTAETVYIYGVPHPIQGRAWGATLSTDGYGTLRIPGHALQCLRVRVIENVIGTRYKAFWFITREGALFYVETTTDYPDTGNVLASSYTSVVGSGLVGVNGETIRPTRFSLQQNYPNPFNPTTIIRYELPESDHVLLRVFDLLGRQVRTLVDGRENAGAHDIELNATGMSSGVYIYRLQAGPFAETKKLIVLR